MESEAMIPLRMQHYLGAGERLLWSGRPKQGILFRAADILLIPFSLLWGGFAIFWESMALSMLFKPGVRDAFPPVAVVFPLFGLPFVAMGLYLIFGRFLVDRKQREKTTYGVTNERVIILSGIFRSTVKSLSLNSLADLSLAERSDGSGTIQFGSATMVPPWLMGARWPGVEAMGPPCFESIPRARSVYDLIRSAQGTQAVGGATSSPDVGFAR